MPNVRRIRSPTSSRVAPGPSTISMRPISGRTRVDVEVGDRAAQIADEAAEEPRAVLPLERELLVVDDD